MQPIVEAEGYLPLHDLIAHGEGFVVTYSHVDFTAGLQGTFYAVIDATGAVRGNPVKLSNGYGRTSALRRGERLLLAWTEEGGTFDDNNLTRTISLGTLSASGKLTGPTYALQTPVINQENVDPRLIDVGEDLGLVWSQGSIIYFCAGCYPNNRLQFAVFGADDFVRKSALLELESPTQFGLLGPHAVSLEDDILITASVTHHVDAEGGSATVRCTP